MNSTDTATSPKFFPKDFKAHVLDRIGPNAAEVDGGDAKVGCFLREAAHEPEVAAHQPEVAAHQPDVARPMKAEPETVGLAKPGLRKAVEFGSDNDPNLEHRPSLAAQGIDRHQQRKE